MTTPASVYYNRRRQRGITSVDPPGVNNPLTATSGNGQRRMLQVGLDIPYGGTGLTAARERLHVSGAFYVGRDCIARGVSVHMSGGTEAVNTRGILYADDGNATPEDTGTQDRNPLARLAYSADPVSVGAGTAPAFYDYTFIAPAALTAGTMVWPGMWTGPQSSDTGVGPQLLRRSNMGSAKVHSNGNTAALFSGGVPSAVFPASNNFSPGAAWTVYLIVDSVVGSATLNATPTSQRGVALAWTLPAGCQAVRITRQIDGAAETTLAVFAGNTTGWIDYDLPLGASVQYRAYPIIDATAGAAASATTTVAGATRRAYTTLTPSLLADSVYVPVPGHGFRKFENTALIPPMIAASTYHDVNGRIGSPFVWATLEPTAALTTNPSDYNFGPIGTFIETHRSATGTKRRVSLRLRCVIPGSSTSDNVPSYIPKTNYGSPSTATPNWNDSVSVGGTSYTVAQRMGRLMVALFAYLTANGYWSAISDIDAGMYASYGENADNPGGPSITNANLQAFWTLLFNAAPPNLPIFVSAPGQSLEAAFTWLLMTYSNAAVAKDSLGSASGSDGLDYQVAAVIGERSVRSRWIIWNERRPIKAEHGNPANIADPAGWQRGAVDAAAPAPRTTGYGQSHCLSTNVTALYNVPGTQAGRDATDDMFRKSTPRLAIVKARVPERIVSGQAEKHTYWWANGGAVRPMESWTPRLQLCTPGTAIVIATAISSLDLVNVYPTAGTPWAHEDTLTFTAPPGTYDLCVHVPGEGPYRDDMRLAMAVNNGSQRYFIGSVVVA